MGTHGGQIHRANDGDACMLNRLARSGERAIAALLGGQVNDHRAGRSCSHHLSGNEERRALAKDLGRADDHIDLGQPARR